MNGREFLLVAYDLLDGLREADWRSAAAAEMVQGIEELIKRFDELDSLTEARARVVDAIKAYEKDILREET